MDVSILAHLQAIAAPVVRTVDVRNVDLADERLARPERIRAVPATDEALGAGLDTYL